MEAPAIDLAGTDLDTQSTTTAGTMHEEGCPFCRPEPGRIRLGDEFATAILDGFPATVGHPLSSRGGESPEPERAEVWAMVDRVKALLLADSRPDGISIGTATGFTVMHAYAPPFR